MSRDHKRGLPSICRRRITHRFNQLELKWQRKVQPWPVAQRGDEEADRSERQSGVGGKNGGDNDKMWVIKGGMRHLTIFWGGRIAVRHGRWQATLYAADRGTILYICVLRWHHRPVSQWAEIIIARRLSAWESVQVFEGQRDLAVFSLQMSQVNSAL